MRIGEVIEELTMKEERTSREGVVCGAVIGRDYVAVVIWRGGRDLCNVQGCQEQQNDETTNTDGGHFFLF